MNSKQKLLIEQVDKKLLNFKKIENQETPTGGWIKTIRTAMKMSLRQLGNRLKITAQSVKEIEKREENGSITLRLLRETGATLNMKFVYGFIPKEDSIEKIIEKRAAALAKDIVMRTSHSMMLEDQENYTVRIKKAIEYKTKEITEKMPNYLWD